MKTLLDFRPKKPELKSTLVDTKHETNEYPSSETDQVYCMKTLMDFKQESEIENGERITNPADQAHAPSLDQNQIEHYKETDDRVDDVESSGRVFDEDDGYPWCSSPEVRDYLECLRTYPCHPNDDENDDPLRSSETRIEKILSGGFSDPQNPPSPLEFYKIHLLFHKTYKTVDPCDFVWDTPENYALAQLYSMSAKVECGVMYLEHAAFYMGYLNAVDLIDRKLVERELFESDFGLCLEELFDREDIREWENDIRDIGIKISRNMQLGSHALELNRNRDSIRRILKPRQPNAHINEILRV